MRTDPRQRRSPSGLWVAVCASVLLLASGKSRAADGSWNVDADGTWNSAGNWLGGIIADGAGSTARLTNDITAIRTVTLSVTQTNGNLTFSDSDPINTPGGGWIVSGAGLTLTNSAATPVITVDLINNIDPTNDAMINPVVTSLQGLVKKGQGTLTLGAANSFSNSVQIDEGILFPLNAGSISTGNRAVIFNGGGVRVALGGPTLTFTNQVLTTATIISSNGNYDAYNGPWNGSGTIFIHATGRLTPGGGNAATFANFTGTIDLTDCPNGNETRLNLGSGSVPYNLSAITLNCGTNAGRFDFRPTVAPCRVLIGALLGGPTSRLQSSENAGGTSLFWEIGYLNTSTTFNGIIANRNNTADRVGHLVKVGIGTLTLTGVSPYTGVTTISNGVLALSGSAALTGATNYITVLSPGTFDVSGLAAPFALGANQTLGGDGVVTGEVAIVSGRIAPGSIGTGSLSFSNNLSIDGTSLTTTNLFKLGSGINDQIRVAGNLTLSGTIALRVVPTGPTIPNGSYVLYQWNGTLTGDTNNLALEFPAQAGTFTLSTNLVTKRIVLQVTGVPSANNLTWRGDGVFNAWDFATPNWRNGGSASLFSNGDKATFDDSGSNNVPVDISFGNLSPGAVLVNATKPYTIGSSAAAGIAGTVSLVKSNTGVLTITADNTYSAGTLIAGGTLQVGDGVNVSGTLGSGIITNNTTLVYNRPDVVVVSPVITGSGVVVERGTGGTLTLNSANTYTGGTIISNGTMRLATYSALSTGPVTLAGGTLEIVPSGAATTGLSNNVNVVADSTLLYDATGTFAAVAFGAFTGNPGVTLSVSHAAAGPDRLRLYGNFTNNANLNLNDAGIALAPYAGSGVQIYNGVISGVGQIVSRAGGAMVFLNAQNTYSGGTTLTTSTLGLGTDSTSSGGIVLSGPVGIGNLILANEGAAVNGNATILASGGPRILENPIVYPNNTNFTFIIGGSSNLTFAGTYSLAGQDGNGGVSRPIQVNNTALTTFAGVIDDTSLVCGITKLGTGTLALNALNTYSGLTTVSNGTLLVNGQSGAGGITVDGGTLGGTGMISGPVTIQSAGSVAPGTSIGTLTINNNLTIAGNLSIEVNKSVSPSNDLVIVTGTLANIGTGTVTVTNLGPALTSGNSFKLFSKPLANGAALTVTGAGVTWVNKLAIDGSIAVASTVSTARTNITFSVTGGNTLNLSWPADHQGWTLQTNAVGLAATNAWFPYPGSELTTNVSVTIDRTKNVFFRMVLTVP
jgi:autotransporter-associated beta strand protein